MIRGLKKLKNNDSGYVLIYVVLLIGFITVLFAGTALALQSRTKVESKTLSDRQLQITAQSALNTIIDQFESDAELKKKLKDYAKNNETATFAMEGSKAVDDGIEVKITDEKDKTNTARITVTATDKNGQKSTTFGFVKYDEPAESTGIVDNLIVAYRAYEDDPAVFGGTENTNILADEHAVKYTDFDGNVIINTKPPKAADSDEEPEIGTIWINECRFTNLITNSNINFSMAPVYGYTERDENGDPVLNDDSTEKRGTGQIVSTEGGISFGKYAYLADDNFDVVAAKKDITSSLSYGEWKGENTKLMTSNGGNIELDSVYGTFGDIISGKSITLNSDNIDIMGNVLSKNDITIDGDAYISGNLVSGENLTLNDEYSVGGNIAAVSKIEGSADYIEAQKGGIYAGRNISLPSLKYLFIKDDIFAGGNYSYGDNRDYTKDVDYTATGRGSISLGTVKENNGKGKGKKSDSNGTDKGTDSDNGWHWGWYKNKNKDDDSSRYQIGGNVIINNPDTALVTNGIPSSKTIYTPNSGNYYSDTIFWGTNSRWRSLLKSVEKGGLSSVDKNNAGQILDGDADIAVAITDQETAAGTEASFTLEDSPKKYYRMGTENKEKGVAVSHNLYYIVDDGQYILRKVAKMLGGPVDSYNADNTTEGSANLMFNSVIPDTNNMPTVTIPSSLSTTAATIVQDGENVKVVGSGYLRVYTDEHGYSTLAGRDETAQPVAYTLAGGRDVVFDTKLGKSYDVLLGSVPMEECGTNGSSAGDVYFPWNIVLDQPEDDPGYVRIFLGDNTTLQLSGYYSGISGYLGEKKTNYTYCSDSDAVPELYIFSNGSKRILVDKYCLSGYIIAPNALVDFYGTSYWKTDYYNPYLPKYAFEGVMLCGTIRTPYYSGHTFKYHRPLTHEKAITSEVFNMPETETDKDSK